MKCSFSFDGCLVFDFGEIHLTKLQPIINGELYSDWKITGIQPGDIIDFTDPLTIRFSSPQLPGTFGLTIHKPPSGDHGSLNFWLENFPQDFLLNAFGLHFDEISGFNTFLKNGYQSWDGSRYETIPEFSQKEDNRNWSRVGYALIQLLPLKGSGGIVMGFDRHDRFQQSFKISRSSRCTALTIETLWDQKQTDNSADCRSENLLIINHSQVEEGLRKWAVLVSKVVQPAARILPFSITGWSSWYNLYAAIDQESIREQLKAAVKVRDQWQMDLKVFQIDDGFTPEMGDWLQVKPHFPEGMKSLLTEIRAAGFIPGLWIAPFMVGNRSQLYINHPDWVVKDRLDGGPLVQMQFYGEFRWHKRSEEYYILDVTHPDALEYIHKVFTIWHSEWGCEYFKTDFMFFGSEHGPDRAVYHTPGKTRIEVWRLAAETIRDAIGDAVWSGCGCPLWASIGLVDAIRVGKDMGVSWRGERSALSLLNDQANRNFGNHILWQIDPDAILLRNRFHHLSDIEIRSLAIYSGMTGGVIMTSDSFDELPPDRIQLFDMLLSTEKAKCSYPFLGKMLPDDASNQLDPVLVQVHQNLGNQAEYSSIFIFNSGDTMAERVYSLSEMGFESGQYLFDWISEKPLPGRINNLNISLQPHDGILYFAADKPFSHSPRKLN